MMMMMMEMVKMKRVIFIKCVTRMLNMSDEVEEGGGMFRRCRHADDYCDYEYDYDYDL